MISQKNRFHGHNAVSKVRGNVAHGKFLSLRYAKNKRKSYRLAVVVSKKVAAKAVTRNRIRRRLYEQIRTQKRFENLPIDAVLYVKSAHLADIDSELLAEEVLSLCKKALADLSQKISNPVL